jgi:hypothetical protein
MSVEWDDDDWDAESWLSSEDDEAAPKFMFYYRFAGRHSPTLLLETNVGLWDTVHREVKAWLQGQVAIVDQYGDPVSLDRADAIVRGAKP